MLDVLTNPITLLCLGIVFLLISLLFFYFKRTISILEKAQMEQAHILQSFISNKMEMSRPIPYQNMNQHGTLPFNNIITQGNDDRISVSDDGIDDNNAKSVNYDNIVMGIDSNNHQHDELEDSDDEDSNDEDSNDEDSNDEDTNDEDENNDGHANENGGLEDGGDDENDNKMNHRVNLNIPVESIKVIQLVDDESLEIDVNIQPNNTSLEDFDKNIHSILDSVSISGSGSDSESEYDSDDDLGEGICKDEETTTTTTTTTSTNMNIGKNIIPSLENNTTTNKQPIHSNQTTTSSQSPILDIKSLNVQSLRQLAENKQLVQVGEKKSKKELIKLLESHKQ